VVGSWDLAVGRRVLCLVEGCVVGGRGAREKREKKEKVVKGELGTKQPLESGFLKRIRLPGEARQRIKNRCSWLESVAIGGKNDSADNNTHLGGSKRKLIKILIGGGYAAPLS